MSASCNRLSREIAGDAVEEGDLLRCAASVRADQVKGGVEKTMDFRRGADEHSLDCRLYPDGIRSLAANVGLKLFDLVVAKQQASRLGDFNAMGEGEGDLLGIRGSA